MNEPKDIDYICVSVPLSPFYVSALCNLNLTNIDLKIPLTDGSHTITTLPTDIGYLRNIPDLVLQAQITLWYEFDSKSETIILCSNDLISEKSVYLTTTLKGTSQTCIQHTYLSDHNPCQKNPNWNYCTPSTPDLQSLLQQTIREANSIIIQKAKESNINVNVQVPLPEMTKEEYEKLSVVYYKGEFLESFDPNKEYDKDHSVENIFSTFGGLFKFKDKQPFANVIGSSKDPKIDHLPWIRLWEHYFGTVEICSSYHFPKGFNCNTDLKKIYGGHVILGEKAKPVTHGLNGVVYIIPICENHNNDDSIYMEPIEYDQAIVLNKYHKPFLLVRV